MQKILPNKDIIYKIFFILLGFFHNNKFLYSLN